MNSLQISCFLAIVEHGSFSRASKELYISQPTISKHIHNLESELGTILFERSKSPVALTPIGEKYFQFFKKAENELLHLSGLSKKYLSSLEGNIKIGILSGWKIPSHLNSALMHFIEHHPYTTLLFENHNVKEMISKLSKGFIDVSLNLVDFVSGQPDLDYETLFDIPKYMIYSKKILPDDHSNVSITDFQDKIFFCLGAGNEDPTHSKIIEYCNYYNFYPTIKSFPNIESVMSNVEFGNGVTILDSLTQFNESKWIKKIELKPCHSVCLAWKKNSQNPLIHLLKDELLAAYPQCSSTSM